MTAPDQYASVRYLVDDVQAAIDFYTTHLGFTLNTSAAPAFADVVRGPLRLLLSGPASSGARATPADAATAGRNRIHLVVDDLDAEIARLRDAGLSFRSDLVTGPGGRQILLADPAGNLIELFQPAHRPRRAQTGHDPDRAAADQQVDPLEPALRGPQGDGRRGRPRRPPRLAAAARRGRRRTACAPTSPTMVDLKCKGRRFDVALEKQAGGPYGQWIPDPTTAADPPTLSACTHSAGGGAYAEGWLLTTL